MDSVFFKFDFNAVYNHILPKIWAILKQNGYSTTICDFVKIDEKQLEFSFKGLQTLWHIAVEIPKFPYINLPRAVLLSPSKLLAHVNFEKTICVHDSQGFSLDFEHPYDIISWVLFDSFIVLEKAEQDMENGGKGLSDELAGYWYSLPSKYEVFCSVQPDNNSREIYTYIDSKSESLLFSEKGSDSTINEYPFKKNSCRKAVYLVLKTGIFLPSPEKPLDNVYFDNILKVFDKRAKRVWTNFVKDKKQYFQCFLLLSAPRSDKQTYSLIGIDISFGKNINDIRYIKPLHIKRLYREYLVERGGSKNINKKVAILGCGSVGSEIADALATCGILNLTLIDFDDYEADNIFRHTLGRYALGQKKVEALTLELKNRYPGIICEPVIKNAIEWIREGKFKEFDVVVMALGQPTIERYIARTIINSPDRTNLVITWVEPLGLGGQVLTFPSNVQNCFDCIFRTADGETALHPIVSFVKPNQKISRNLTGCGGSFVPYSALHSRRTALLAAEEIVKLLEGKNLFQYNFWAGDRNVALERNISLSEWFNNISSSTPEELSDELFKYHSSSCGLVK